MSDLIKADIKAVTEALVKDANRIRLAAMNPLKGDISRRVFQQGTSTDGSPIGQYATSTKKFRNLVGRRIDKVDLQMLGTLKDSLIVGESENRVVMGISEVPEVQGKASKHRKGGFATLQVGKKTDFTTVENAITQEKHFNKSIFAPSDQEVDKSLKNFDREFKKTTDKALGGNKTIKIKK